MLGKVGSELPAIKVFNAQPADIVLRREHITGLLEVREMIEGKPSAGTGKLVRPPK